MATKNGTTYIKEWTRSGSVLWDTVVCGDCLSIHVREVCLRPGEQRVTRPWTGKPTPCGMCSVDEDGTEVAHV